jgi:hypothetical protein
VGAITAHLTSMAKPSLIPAVTDLGAVILSEIGEGADLLLIFCH